MLKRSKFKTGLNFGIAMTVFFIIQNLLIYDNHSSKEIIKSIISAVIGGLIVGLLFGWIIGLMSKSRFLSKGLKVDTDPDEEIIFQTSANHFKGIEGVGGKLFLTNNRLLFKSHKFNIQNHQLSINLTDIFSVDRYKTLGLTNNGLKIITKSNVSEKFVVEEIDEWVKQLTN